MTAAVAKSEKQARPGTHRTDAVTDVALTMPIFVAYHLGVVFLPVRNAADVVTSRLASLAEHSKLAYMGLTAGLGAAVVIGLLATGQRDKLKMSTFALVAIEGVIYAMTMRYLAGAVTSALPLAAGAVEKSDLLTAVTMSLGAGFYEELAFRVGAFGLGARFLLAIDEWPKWLVYPLWAIVCATGFSAWHHVGAMGEPFELHAFVFRTVCGIAFTAIFLFRGFAPAVWTHALYDVWVMAL